MAEEKKDNLKENKMDNNFDIQNNYRSKDEIEECVELIRLELYNRDLPCGPNIMDWIFWTGI